MVMWNPFLFPTLSFSNLKNKQHKNATLRVVSFSSETPCVSSIISCDWGFLKSIPRSSEPKLQACLMINDRTCWELLQLTFSGLMSLLWSAESLLMNSSLCLISPPSLSFSLQMFPVFTRLGDGLAWWGVEGELGSWWGGGPCFLTVWLSCCLQCL